MQFGHTQHVGVKLVGTMTVNCQERHNLHMCGCAAASRHRSAGLNSYGLFGSRTELCTADADACVFFTQNFLPDDSSSTASASS